METKQVLFSLLFLSFLSFCSPLLTQNLLAATDSLCSSGYLSMSLTLQLVSDFLVLNYPFLTVFAPNDAAFADLGQPSLALLEFHFSPIYFPLHALKSLPSGSKIPTLLTNRTLTITSLPSDDVEVSLNGVKISGSPIYDDGFLVIFGIDKFFNLGFGDSWKIPVSPACSFRGSDGYYSFKEASEVLRSQGYSVMASFLDLQVLGFKDPTMLTILAPVDEVMNNYLANVSEYSSIFLRHVVPCKIPWRDLAQLDDGVVLDTYLEGFGINIMRSGGIVMLNGVPISFSDMYQNDWLVIHGLSGMLKGPHAPPGDVPSGSKICSDCDDL